MSNQEKKPQHEPAKRAPLVVEPKPRRRRGFFSLLFSHLMVALIAVIAVSAYMHWTDILKYTGSRVCAYDVLGQYGTQPVKVPPVDLKKSTTKKSEEKTESQKTPAEEKPQADTSSTPENVLKRPGFKSALQAARKLFWAQDPSALAAYEKLVAENPENADLRAELGNAYFKMGKKDKAAQTYVEAAKQFARQKDNDKVVGIKNILKKFAPEKLKNIDMDQ